MNEQQLYGGLLRLLQIKKELLAKLLKAFMRAADDLRNEDMDEFDLEMEHCGNLMAVIDETAVTEDKLRRQTPDAPSNPEVAGLEDDIAYILGQVSEAREECNDIAEQKLKAYGQQIKAVRYNRKGINGYAGFQSKDAFFIDEKK